MNDPSATQVKNFDFDNNRSKKIFSHPYIYYMASKRLQGVEQFQSRSYFLKMPRSHACENAFEMGTTKTELANSKRYIKKLDTRL